ncbi:hypothetical protein BARBAKC583_0885 [Bartonella bacilliformis KC583]|uniref:Uncharacterized protein n=1 Tax=Bartonella bacilliformis (strain ATCC 35685 / KC583 / Herrer 020/F12,63) TaxID=360095 RepID=A1UT67_BARBK|nr:hypothetical protein BARBAKC583_0885 [Bartonella bacilliformis KC583]
MDLHNPGLDFYARLTKKKYLKKHYLHFNLADWSVNRGS